MTKRITGVILLLMLAFLSTPAQAQRRKAKTPPTPKPASPMPPAARNDTSIKSTTLEVYQVYQPEMKALQKPGYAPSLPPNEKEPQPQHYEVPQQTLLYSYRALPLRPLALGKDTAPLPPQNYILLGGGNLSTALAEAGIGGLQVAQWKGNIYGRYLSQEGSTANQIYRNFLLKSDASWNDDHYKLDAGLDLSRNVFGRYGYDHSLQQFNLDDVRMKYDAARLHFGLHNTSPGIWNLDYAPTLNLLAWDGRQGHETDLQFFAPISRRIDSSFSLGLALNVQGSWNSLASSLDRNQSSNLFQVLPFADYRSGNLDAHLSLAPTWSEGADLLWLPDIRIGFQFLNKRIRIEATGKAERMQNTLQQLSEENPYFFPGNFSIRQSTRAEVAGAVQAALGNHLSVWGRIAWQHLEDAPLFITSAGSDGKDFSIIYEHEIRALCWGGGLRYQVGEYFSLGAEGQWLNYYQLSMLQHAYGMPGIRLKGDLSWRLTKGLLLTSYMQVLDEIWGLDAYGHNVRQRGVFDFGAAAEYHFFSKLSAFIHADNLLGRRNERWLGYPSFGFNLYGGLRYRF
ncbi:MAG: hypothetical protein JST06_02885 [Bacteroidetes bacterium]|nr:hypothetical protein [Bacteroidota bacterium]